MPPVRKTRLQVEIVNTPLGPPKRHRDTNWLRLHYLERERSIEDMASDCDASPEQVERWLKKFGIYSQRDDDDDDDTNPYVISDNGYDAEQAAKGRGGYSDTFRGHTRIDNYGVHRLTAIAEYGVDAVAGKLVHHRNEIPYDNRPSNLIPLDTGEHTSIRKLRKWHRRFGPLDEWPEKFKGKRETILEHQDREFILQEVQNTTGFE